MPSRIQVCSQLSIEFCLERNKNNAYKAQEIISCQRLHVAILPILHGRTVRKLSHA